MRNLGRTRPDIPHPKSNVACRVNDDFVLDALIVKQVVIETDVAHDPIHETGRKVCFSSVMNLALEI